MNDLGISRPTRNKTLLLLKIWKLLLILLKEVYKYNWFQINNIKPPRTLGAVVTLQV